MTKLQRMILIVRLSVVAALVGMVAMFIHVRDLKLSQGMSSFDAALQGIYGAACVGVGVVLCWIIYVKLTCGKKMEAWKINRQIRRTLEKYKHKQIEESYEADEETCSKFCSGGDLESDNSELLDEILTDSVCGSGPVVDEDKVTDWLVSYGLELDLAREQELEGTMRLGRSGPVLLVFPFGFNPFTGREDWNYDGPRAIPPGLLESYDSTFDMLFRANPQKTLKLSWRDIYSLI